MESGGHRLRRLRERLGLTVRQVQMLSANLASKHDNSNYFIDKARLSDIEAKGVLPNIYKFYSLAAIYHRSIAELLEWYGVNADQLPGDVLETALPNTHLGGTFEIRNARCPTELEPTFDPRETSDIGRLITKWGTVPLPFLAAFEHSSTYFGYIGTEDWTMYPILLPGAFVEIDQSKRKIEAGPWESEYDRPVYFVETRESVRCGWCALEGSNLIVQPHPRSPERLRLYRYGSDAEVIGQVVAVAMRLDRNIHPRPQSSSQARTTTNQDARVIPHPFPKA